jgi:hypothetical protein
MAVLKCSFLLLLISGVFFLVEGRMARDEFPVPRPPLSKGIFPCSSCHEGIPVNPAKRELKDEHIDIKLHHADRVRSCLDCHDPNNRDRMRLVNGELVGFEESYLLCGQCHGTTYRDWKAGIHGKRSGYFDGKRTYLLCVHCHNPHDPKFKPIKPEPPPHRPRDASNAR